jgi:hypothetical protein
VTWTFLPCGHKNNIFLLSSCHVVENRDTPQFQSIPEVNVIYWLCYSLYKKSIHSVKMQGYLAKNFISVQYYSKFQVQNWDGSNDWSVYRYVWLFTVRIWVFIALGLADITWVASSFLACEHKRKYVIVLLTVSRKLTHTCQVPVTPEVSVISWDYYSLQQEDYTECEKTQIIYEGSGLCLMEYSMARNYIEYNTFHICFVCLLKLLNAYHMR